MLDLDTVAWEPDQIAVVMIMLLHLMISSTLILLQEQMSGAFLGRTPDIV